MARFTHGHGQGKEHKQSGTGLQTDRDRVTNGQGQKLTGTQTGTGTQIDGDTDGSERKRDTGGQGEVQRRTKRGTGTQMDRERDRINTAISSVLLYRNCRKNVCMDILGCFVSIIFL